MRRILLLIAGALALALAVPGVASAHHGRGRHHHHHAKAHHARTEHFGAASNTSPSPGMPDAGTVASFTNGVLTIRLADGSTVSGNVTSDTNINCVPAVQSPTPTAATADDGGWSGDRGDQGDQGDDSQGDEHHGGGRCHGQSACTVADLVPGATVHEAILKLGGNGAEFKLVLLVKQQQATS